MLHTHRNTIHVLVTYSHSISDTYTHTEENIIPRLSRNILHNPLQKHCRPGKPPSSSSQACSCRWDSVPKVLATGSNTLEHVPDVTDAASRTVMDVCYRATRPPLRSCPAAH